MTKGQPITFDEAVLEAAWRVEMTLAVESPHRDVREAAILRLLELREQMSAESFQRVRGCEK